MKHLWCSFFVLAVYYFGKQASSQMFERVVNTCLVVDSISLNYFRLNSVDDMHQRNNSLDSSLSSSSNEAQRTKRRLVGIVVYDYLAHNNKELTINAGEKVEVSLMVTCNHMGVLFVRVAHSRDVFKTQPTI